MSIHMVVEIMAQDDAHGRREQLKAQNALLDLENPW